VRNTPYQKRPWRHRRIQARRVLIFLFRNYGPTIAVGNQAQKQGHQQVLWLWNNKIGEIGSSNIFFVLTDKNTKKRKVITPALEDLVLPGVTRDSIIVSFSNNFSNFYAIKELKLRKESLWLIK
jgi:branched-chain amino acid aminotransferase